MITLYWGSGSPFAWRVQLALEIKGLAYESKLLQFSKMEHKSPEVLALNPRGKVPVLKDGDHAVYESLAILTYLDKKYPQVPLMGRTAEEASLIMQRINEFQSYLEGPVRNLSRTIFNGSPQSKILEENLPLIHQELKIWEETLKNSRWLVGDAVSAADVVLLPGLLSIIRAATRPIAKSLDLKFLPLEEHYPSLNAWKIRMEALPNFEKTYPPHWRENP